MSATAEELRAEVERLRGEFDPADAEARRIARNGGGWDGQVPDELRAKTGRLGREIVATLKRLEVVADPSGLTKGGGAKRYDELHERAEQAATTKAEAAQEIEDSKAPRRFDPESGEPLDKLGVLNLATKEIGGNVEWLRVRQIGLQDARWHLTAKSHETGEPAELRSFTTPQLFEGSLSKLSARVREVRAGRLPTPRKGSDNWVKFTDALTDAAEIEQHGGTEAGSWRRRLAAYLDGRVDASRDLSKPEGKRGALADPAGPMEGPGGRLWVHVGAWLEYLETRRMEADEGAVRAALRLLGFERRQLTARVGGEPRSRWYWVSPQGFDWREEQA